MHMLGRMYLMNTEHPLELTGEGYGGEKGWCRLQDSNL